MASSARPSVLAAPMIVVPPLLFAVLLVVAGSYNGILAFVNAHGMTITYGKVALFEMALLAAGGLLVIASGLTERDGLPFLLLWVFTLIALLMSIGYDFPLVQMIRNMAIIAVFTMVGMRMPTRTLHNAALVLSIVTLAVLILEISSQSVYVSIFQPAKYLESSRGITQAQFNETGLFANALGFEGRFSFGIFKIARTSSIFIEQVSLAGFAAVLTVYLLSQWSRMPVWHRVIHSVLIVLILVSNNSRTSSGLFVVSLAGFFIYPLLPRFLNFAIAPALLAGAAILVGMKGGAGSDDLLGRLNVTIRGLGSMSAQDLLIGSPGLAFNSLDSGYVYVTAASTLFGMIAYWLYVCMIVPHGSVVQRRTLWGLNTYIFIWLLIGGTATFTIKTAALLWVIVGNARVADAAAASADAAQRPARRGRRARIGGTALAHRERRPARA